MLDPKKNASTVSHTCAPSKREHAAKIEAARAMVTSRLPRERSWLAVCIQSTILRRVAEAGVPVIPKRPCVRHLSEMLNVWSRDVQRLRTDSVGQLPLECQRMN